MDGSSFYKVFDMLAFDSGIWYTSSAKTVSYPGEGNALCFQLEDSSFWFRHRNDCILAAAERFSPLEPFFDIGGGNGFVSAALQHAGREVVLIEPGQEAVSMPENGASGISSVVYWKIFQWMNLL